MATDRPVPVNLRAARRSLADLSGFELLNDWTWYEGCARWALHCRLTVDVASQSPIPRSTEWFALVQETYPRGDVKVFPAAEGGITDTFQHQNCNAPASNSDPWRRGDLCLHRRVHPLGRSAFDDEPFDAGGMCSRLRWHLERAIDWINDAAAGVLARPGDPFELPKFVVRSKPETMAFAEDAATFVRWNEIKHTGGSLELSRACTATPTWVVRVFNSHDSTPLVSLPWGGGLFEADAEPIKGSWVRLPRPLILAPWKAPITWSELRRACKEQGANFDKLLWKAMRRLPVGDPHMLLVGFPIPARVGGEDTQMHWQAALLPGLREVPSSLAGFRRGGPYSSWILCRRQVMRDDNEIPWIGSENWSTDQLASRGRLPSTIAGKRVLLIGAGALGSAAAEMLVRAGVHELAIADGEDLVAGNLCRHTLGLSDLGKNKAAGLARRLAQGSPHALVQAITHEFPPRDAQDRELVQRCEIVIECTGDDLLLHELRCFPWRSPRTFVSMSIGFAAGRLFCFIGEGVTFPLAAYKKAIRPWTDREARESAHVEFAQEGVGCWHPVFPARIDDVWILAAAGVKQIETTLAGRDHIPELTVFQQQYHGGAFLGVARARTVEANTAHGIPLEGQEVRTADPGEGTQPDAAPLREGKAV